MGNAAKISFLSPQKGSSNRYLLITQNVTSFCLLYFFASISQKQTENKNTGNYYNAIIPIEPRFTRYNSNYHELFLSPLVSQNVSIQEYTWNFYYLYDDNDFYGQKAKSVCYKANVTTSSFWNIQAVLFSF